MVKPRTLALLAVIFSPVAICQGFDTLMLDCRIQIPVEFEVETREGMGSKVSFRYVDMDLMKKTTMSVSRKGEWQSNNPLDRSPHEIISEQKMGSLKHLTVRPVELGPDTIDYEIITDGSTIVRIYGDDREAFIAQFQECPEV